MEKRRRTAVVVGLVGMALVSLIAVRILASSGWDATIFISVGEDATAIREYAEERLGTVFLRSQQGHDGKFFFVQANDPLLLEPDRHAAVFDRPLYRAQRMLFPLIAGGFGAFSPRLIVWSMLVTNLIAIGVGTLTVALVAQVMKGSPWWGLAFAVNPGFISEVSIGGAGVIAAAAAFGAVLAFRGGRDRWGVLLLVLAGLSREAMLIAAAGSALWLWRRRRQRLALAAVAFPSLAVMLWAIYLRIRLGWGQGATQIEEIGVPLRGLYEALQSWISDPIDLVIGLAMTLLLVLYARRALRSDELVGWAFLGFVALAVVFTEQVWRSYFDITRAIAPVITSYVLLVVVNSSRMPSDDQLARDLAS